VKIFATILFISAALFVTGCRSSSPPSTLPKTAQRSDWPRTVDEAVTRLLAELSDADKARLRAEKKDDLIKFHHGWGTSIRNCFGLWAGNKELMADCHAFHPDDASMVIIEAVWQRLQKQ
jgi:hypothetical protein